MIPSGVLRAYGIAGDRVEPIAGGLINTSYLVRDEAGAPALILQRLHPIFAGPVNLDIEAVTEHLAARGLETPRLVRTAGGDAWVEDEGAVWRALSHVDGVTFHRFEDAAQAESAGELVGRFHRALADLERSFQFVRAGVHDTAAHLARLAAATMDAAVSPAVAAEAEALRADILAAAAALPPMPDLPLRLCHGDLKVSNLRFSADRRTALCLIDLDTLGQLTIAYELGDALRSWCNPSGEDVAEPEPDLELLAAAMRGYARGADGLLSDAEVGGIAIGFETVCIELAARFCYDAFEDRYFGWDSARFSSRREHNLVRARGQLALGLAVARSRDDVRARIRAAF